MFDNYIITFVDQCEIILGFTIADDDDADYAELFLWYSWPTKERIALLPTATIVRDPHHCESPTHRKQDLNLRRTWVQGLLYDVVQ